MASLDEHLPKTSVTEVREHLGFLQEESIDESVKKCELAKVTYKRELFSLLRDNNELAIEAISLNTVHIFTHHDLLGEVRTRNMLFILLKNGLDLNKCSWKDIMMHRVWIVEFLMNYELKVKLNPNSSSCTYGMPVWRLLMCCKTRHLVTGDVLRNRLPNANFTEKIDIFAKDSTGHIYCDKYHTEHRISDKYITYDGGVFHKPEFIFHRPNDADYDKKIRKYMELQVLYQRIEYLEQKLSKT